MQKKSINLTTLYHHINPRSCDSGREGPHLLLLAGVHGDEYEPVAALTALRNVLEADVQLACGKVSMVPVVNESAFARGERTGEDGQDLARTCPGNKAGSITERVAFEVSDLIRSADCLIDLHTGGNLFDIFPLAGYMLSADPEILKKQRAMAQAFDLPVIWGTSPELEGRTLSVARDAGIPAIYTEYGGGGRCRGHIVQKLKEGVLNVMRWMKMLEGPPKKGRGEQYVIEDYRKGSGHLQIMYPSPLDGIFSATAELGDIVEKGQPIGQVVNPVSRKSAVIRAEEAGLLFLIRHQALVKAQEATGGILPITEPGNISIS